MPQRAALHSEEYKLFCRHLRATVKASNCTQAQLSKKLGKPQSYVSKCLTQERRMGIVELYQMCHAIDMPLADFAREMEEIFDTMQETQEDRTALTF